MKIALTGSHGTGKTTLAYELTAELKKHGINATMCTEVARKCPFPIHRKGNFQSQLWIFVTQIKDELEAEKDYEFVVCDRSVLDTYAYTKYLLTSADTERLWAFARENLKTYDLLFKTPIIDSYIIEDGVRDTDKKFQQDIDAILNKFLNESKIPYIELPKTNQLKFILDKIAILMPQHFKEI